MHLELASMSDPLFVQQMAATMFPIANSFGLNEEELAFTFDSLHGSFSTKGMKTDMLTGKTPDVDAVVEALAFLLSKADEWAPFQQLMQECWHQTAPQRPLIGEVKRRLKVMLDQRHLHAQESAGESVDVALSATLLYVTEE